MVGSVVEVSVLAESSVLSLGSVSSDGIYTPPEFTGVSSFAFLTTKKIYFPVSSVAMPLAVCFVSFDVLTFSAQIMGIFLLGISLN